MYDSFKEQENPEAFPDCDTLQEFFWWYAKTSKGKIGEKPTVATLAFKVGRFAFMYEKWYNYKIPEEVLEDVREVRKLCL
jgi:hypothetical protein